MNLAVAVIPFVLLPFFGFSQYTDELKWLEGNWIMESEGTTIESWSIKDDSNLFGYSVTLENGNETFRETLSIENSANGLIYKAVLPFKTAVFTLDSIAKNYVSFMDPQNDFPSKIEYRKVQNELRITLVGAKNKMEMKYRKM